MRSERTTRYPGSGSPVGSPTRNRCRRTYYRNEVVRPGTKRVVAQNRVPCDWEGVPPLSSRKGKLLPKVREIPHRPFPPPTLLRLIYFHTLPSGHVRTQYPDSGGDVRNTRGYQVPCYSPRPFPES